MRERILAEGPLSFRDVMHAALYHPSYGYYTNLRGFGAQGDFVTSPSTHPAFGFLVARQAVDVWDALGRPRPFRILELGGGDGALAASLLSALSSQPDRPDVDYAIQEPSPALRRAQQSRLGTNHVVVWNPAPSEQYHLVVANEVADALPVQRVAVRNGQLHELRVTLAPDGALTWIEAEDVPPEVRAYFARLKLRPPEGAIADVPTGLETWVPSVAARLVRGLALILDYGYTAEELFSDRRKQGTLLTYYRHTLGSDPLVRLGRQDISAHVDFSTVALLARERGLHVAGVTSQRALLRNLGAPQVAQTLRSPADRDAFQSLSDPDGLGRLGALFLTRGLPGYEPVGLRGRDDWPPPGRVPSLPANPRDDQFLELWREAFPVSEEDA